MTEVMNLSDMCHGDKILLLKELDYSTDGLFIFKDGEKVFDEYIDEPVTLDNMVILPGSSVILDNNALSIASYLEDHPDISLF